MEKNVSETALEKIGKAIHSKRVAVIMHNNPDPDSIAAAFGMSLLFRKYFKVECEMFYGGIIGRAENRAMVSLLRIPLKKIEGLDLRVYRTVVLVDTQPSAGNNELPGKVNPNIVIDHHRPLRKKTRSAEYYDVRDRYGATSTIVLEYLRASGIKIPRNVATALFYGIKTDTYDLGRSIIRQDIDSYDFLKERLNRTALASIEKPLHTAQYFVQIHNALRNVEISGDALMTVLRDMEYPDITAEVADWLYTLKTVRWVLVLGVDRNGVIFISVRTRDRKRDAGRLIREVVGKHGMAGGHGQIGGGSVALGTDDEKVIMSELARIRTRFFQMITGRDVITTTGLIPAAGTAAANQQESNSPGNA
ncbi:MAG TPA: DHH family phosphoesterase [bacterium]|nr:DHH family phosphoesterase [bacterium]